MKQLIELKIIELFSKILKIKKNNSLNNSIIKLNKGL